MEKENPRLLFEMQAKSERVWTDESVPMPVRNQAHKVFMWATEKLEAQGLWPISKNLN